MNCVSDLTGLLPRVSLRTLYREMRRCGYRWSCLKRKGVLSPQDHTGRLAWCRSHRHLPLSHWRNVSIYLDAVSFLYKENPLEAARSAKTRGWLRRSEKLLVTVKGRHEHDSKSGSVRFVVGIAHGQGCVLCHKYDELSGASFAQLLKQNLPAAFARGQKSGRVVLQDNCPVQNSAAARAAYESFGVVRQIIPPRSPDLNPIENLFNCVKLFLQEEAIEKRISKETIDQFATRVEHAIHTVCGLYTDATVDSMPKRIRQILGSRGRRASY